MDAAVYKHVVLGLVFLKYVSDSFMDRFNELIAEDDGFEEERDAYAEKNVFWVPKQPAGNTFAIMPANQKLAKLLIPQWNALKRK